MQSAALLILVLLVSGCASTSIIHKPGYGEFPPTIKSALVVGAFFDPSVSGMAERSFQQVFGKEAVATTSESLSSSESEALAITSTNELENDETRSRLVRLAEATKSAGIHMVVLISKNPVSDKSTMTFRGQTDIGETSTYNPFHETTNHSPSGGYAAEDPREQLRVVVIEVSSWKIAWAGSVVSHIQLNKSPEQLFKSAFTSLKRQAEAGLPNNSLKGTP